MSAIPSTRVPHTFAVFTTEGGARVFRLPLNVFPDFWAYAYLVLVGDYRVLIDTGSGFGDSNAHLEEGLRRVGQEIGETIRLKDLTHILITHGHIDHFGGLTFLRSRTRARVGVHELDLRNLTNYEERLTVIERRLRTFLQEAGLSAGSVERVMAMYKINKSLFRSVDVDFTYEAEGMHLGPFEFLHVPGHCAGHVVIRLHDVLFTGDHVLDGISPHQSPERLTLGTGLGHYLESLSLLEAWGGDARLTLCGHNDPIRDLPARLRAIRQVHAERLQRTLELLAEPHTITELSKALFGKVEGYHILLALEEAGAHVEYLYQRGLIGIANLDEVAAESGSTAIRYRRLDDSVARRVHLLEQPAWTFVH
ncbi:MAG: MBL fold metallo-hydrolase [Anaerolineae bacterium]|nr:MAG: MBL fold metallo-hydrolase [Anaerolineae bacterium]